MNSYSSPSTFIFNLNDHPTLQKHMWTSTVIDSSIHHFLSSSIIQVRFEECIVHVEVIKFAVVFVIYLLTKISKKKVLQKPKHDEKFVGFSFSGGDAVERCATNWVPRICCITVPDVGSS
jgi:hypothetical protein